MRPCQDKHSDPRQQPDCTFCLLWVRKRNYREKWGGVWTEEDDAVNRQGPSLVRKVVNFTVALTSHVVGGLPQTPEDVRENRAAICRACVGPAGYYDVTSGICLHPDCGCKMLRKIAWDGQRCPIGKW